MDPVSVWLDLLADLEVAMEEVHSARPWGILLPSQFYAAWGRSWHPARVLLLCLQSYAEWMEVWHDVPDASLRGRKQPWDIVRHAIAFHPASQAICRMPQIQQHTEQWHASRQVRLTGSVVGVIFNAPKSKKPANPTQLWACGDGMFRNKRAKCIPKDMTRTSTLHAGCQYAPAPIVHGNVHEKVAFTHYEEEAGTFLFNVGLVEHPKYPFLGASPDALRMDRPTLVEFKCPFRRDDALLAASYWPQCQLQMQCTGAADVDLFIFWTYSLSPVRTEATTTIPITRDDAWFAENLPILQANHKLMRACWEAGQGVFVPGVDPVKKRPRDSDDEGGEDT